jgi:predicted transposase/invertase (TIGR01784 family)
MIEIDPTVDYACKMLLGNPSHSRLTVHFLNAVLKPESPIMEVAYLNPIIPQEFEADKLAILDILATDILGRKFNIEVQRTNPSWLAERLTYYASTQLVEQISEGDNYTQLRPSIGICLLKAIAFRAPADYHHEFRLRTSGGLELTKCLEIHLLELPKYLRTSDNRRVIDPLDQWMDFFGRAYGSSPESIRQRLGSSIFDEALGVLDMISKTPEQRRYYNARLKWELDENTRRAAEEAARAACHAEGLAEGEARGEAKGVAIGKAQLVRVLQGLLGLQESEESELLKLTMAELDAMIVTLQNQFPK